MTTLRLVRHIVHDVADCDDGCVIEPPVADAKMITAKIDIEIDPRLNYVPPNNTYRQERRIESVYILWELP